MQNNVIILIMFLTSLCTVMAAAFRRTGGLSFSMCTSLALCPPDFLSPDDEWFGTGEGPLCGGGGGGRSGSPGLEGLLSSLKFAFDDEELGGGGTGLSGRGLPCLGDGRGFDGKPPAGLVLGRAGSSGSLVLDTGGGGTGLEGRSLGGVDELVFFVGAGTGLEGRSGED